MKTILARVEESLNRWGYAHTEVGALLDEIVEEQGWLIRRGLAVDTIVRNDEQGRRMHAASKPRR